MTTSRLYVDPDYVARAAEDDKFALAFARIESHYFVHGGFFKVPAPASTSAPNAPL
jgi:proline iminopeptidase